VRAIVVGVSEDGVGRDDQARGVVERGYDAAAGTHLDWLGRIEGDPRLEYLDDLLGRLPVGARVLDLGCGAGVPNTRLLAERCRVTGVDISASQLRLARAAVPGAEFVQADIGGFNPGRRRFDAVTAFYSVSHLPRDGHAELFRRIASWLVPGGLFLASLGATGCPDAIEQWLGVPMFFSSFGADDNRRLVRDAGLALLRDDVVTMREPEGPATFLWVLASRPR
jgi:SAM-dependent methyltransferase